MRVRVDPALCSGQGRCYVVSPDVYDSDDEGFCLQRGKEFEVAARSEESAELGAASCPEGAISIINHV